MSRASVSSSLEVYLPNNTQRSIRAQDVRSALVDLGNNVVLLSGSNVLSGSLDFKGNITVNGNIEVSGYVEFQNLLSTDPFLEGALYISGSFIKISSGSVTVPIPNPASPTPSVTPSISRSPLPPSVTPSPVSPSVTPTPTRTPSVTPSPVSPSITPTPTRTPSSSPPPPSVTPTPTRTPSVTPSISRSPLPPSVTPTPTRTPSVTPSISTTPPLPPSPSLTPTPSPSDLGAYANISMAPTPTPECVKMAGVAGDGGTYQLCRGYDNLYTYNIGAGGSVSVIAVSSSIDVGDWTPNPGDGTPKQNCSWMTWQPAFTAPTSRMNLVNCNGDGLGIVRSAYDDRWYLKNGISSNICGFDFYGNPVGSGNTNENIRWSLWSNFLIFSDTALGTVNCSDGNFFISLPSVPDDTTIRTVYMRYDTL